jgi:arginase
MRWTPSFRRSEYPLVSSLRARCPNCRTFTAVAVDAGYECHSCGSSFLAGLVRVPAAWGVGGEGMVEGARVELPYPEVAIVERPSLDEQTRAIANALASRPVVLGGCCCAHVGAATGVARRVDRLAVVWIDSHGDLNTPESSPSGNLWGMPFRMLLDDGVVAPEDAALVGVRNLDPPEKEYMTSVGLDDSLERALEGVGATYVALDLDVLDPAEVDVLIPEPDGLSADELETLLRDVADRTTIVGMGVTGLLASERNAELATRMLAAAGF